MMTDKEIGRAFRALVLEKGLSPFYHDRIVHRLASLWPAMHNLIRRVEQGL